MNDFCDLLGTPDVPVSKIASVKRFDSNTFNNRKAFKGQTPGL
jgi:hypothetical protein